MKRSLIQTEKVDWEMNSGGNAEPKIRDAISLCVWGNVRGDMCVWGGEIC